MRKETDRPREKTQSGEKETQISMQKYHKTTLSDMYTASPFARQEGESVTIALWFHVPVCKMSQIKGERTWSLECEREFF